MTRSKYSDEPYSNRAAQAGDLKPPGGPRHWLPCLTRGLGWVGLVVGISFSVSAQQVIRGEPGQASEHVVVNFRGLAELDRLYGLGSNGAPRAVHPPYPLRQGTNPPPPGGATSAAAAPAAH